MKSRRNLYAILFLIIAGTAISFFLFKPIVQHPNRFLYATEGDAAKSYYNFSYCIKYNNGVKHDGINYPYGEHLQYINSHPLYVAILSFIDDHLFEVSDYGVGILNITMIFSLVLALPFIFLILRRYKLPVWYSIIISLIIIYLSPQFDRIHGHFEMVYAFFIPLFWYLTILFLEGKRKYLSGGLLLISGLVGGFTSAYYVAMYSIFLLAVLMVKLWQNRKQFKEKRREIIGLFILAILPLIIVKGVVNLTDWATDRPEDPWGFFVFHSNIFSIFLPYGSHLNDILGNPHFMDYQWEGRAYVGLPSTILAVIIFISVIYSLVIKGKLMDFRIFYSKKLNLFLIASFIVLLFSMCFPFKYGLAFLPDLIPPIKQFRALGRFSWIFYYIFTVFTAHIIYSYFRLLKLKSRNFIAFIFIFIAIGFWLIDAGVNMKRSQRGLKNKNALFAPELEDSYLKLFKDKEVDISDYQAILFVPFSNTCGDKLLFPRGFRSFSQAMKCSYFTGLPLIQSYSPRLPFSNAFSSIQMLADPPIRKERLDDMTSKPLLIISTDEKLSPQETWIINKSEKLFTDNRLSFFEFDLKNYPESYDQWHNEVEGKIADLKFKKDNIAADTSLQLCIYMDYDEQKDNYVSFSGPGSFFQKKGQHVLVDKEQFKKLEQGMYDISFWLFIEPKYDNMPEVLFYSWNEEGRFLERAKWNTRERHNVYNQWVRIDSRIELKENTVYSLEIKGKYVSLDDLLIKPWLANVYVKKESSPDLFNNYVFEK